MTEENPRFEVQLELLQDYRCEVSFDQAQMGSLWMDEPQPLGSGSGPNASRMLAAAVGNCLSASLLFCLNKARVPHAGVQTRVAGELVRNAKGRLRVGHLEVTMVLLGEAPQPQGRLERCLGMFEDFCVVSASVRQGIPISVCVEHRGQRLHYSG